MGTERARTAPGEKKDDYIFALDIGTRSVIGMVGTVEREKLCVTAIEKEEHGSRAMVDGQIEDIARVAGAAMAVKRRLEDKVRFQLERVHVAAAGRALQTQRAAFDLELPEPQQITEEVIRELEAGAINAAEDEFEKREQADGERQFYLVGYSVCQYYLDSYPISSLLNHKGMRLTADVIATFLPGEVVESLYTSMQEAGLEVASMTLEPIASMNAAIPQELRLLNLVLVDIGAGTSDIAAARDGSICGYTMATVAGDEVTECLMKTYLIDFATAESLKMGIDGTEDMVYKDVLGMEYSVTPGEVMKVADPAIQSLCKQITDRILEVNGSAPSAVFLVGGGSKLANVREYVAQYLNMDLKRVALGGNNFSIHACSDEYDLNDPEYSTPLGIAVSAALNLISDSFYIRLNGERAKLFRSGRLSVRDVLMMNGFGYKHMISRSGQNMVITLDGERKVIHGGYAQPAQLTLNGRQAALSDLVHAGDEILFVPARNGDAAAAALGTMIDLKEEGLITWKGRELSLGTTATVNGEAAGAERQLQNGDEVRTCRIYTAGDLAAVVGAGGTLAVNGVPVPPEWILEPGDLVDQSPEMKREALAQAGPVGSREAAAPPFEQKEVSFRLNGQSLTLKEKDNHQPYYLMDMLAHANVDFSKPEGDIILKVNGREAGFQTELRGGDAVEIHWAKGNT